MKYLISGGTGTIGTAIIKRLIEDNNVQEIRCYSRDEYKQSEMARKITSHKVKYWLGDVCDFERLKEACKDVDVIIHTAAMKRMDNSSHNTYAVANVNITGTQNIMRAGKNADKIVLVSTDKAFQPSCVYGASKMIAESITLADPKGIVWRFGNFIGSRGSVWEIFEDQKKTGVLTLTDPKATRFVISLDEAVDCLLSPVGHGLHHPKDLKIMSVQEIADSICPDCEHKIIGLREGEKLYESFNETYTSKK
jgi:UDP-N-acetylglucosamine 4,6-dehydratase